MRWPVICEYFGLRVVAPTDGSGPDPHGFFSENRKEWSKTEKKYGLQTGRFGENTRSVVGLPFFIMRMLNSDPQLNLDKMYHAWEMAKEEVSNKDACYIAFNRFREARIIPECYNVS